MYYFDWHHSANDTLDKIEAKDLDQNVAAWAAAVCAAAEMKGDLGGLRRLRRRSRGRPPVLPPFSTTPPTTYRDAGKYDIAGPE